LLMKSFRKSEICKFRSQGITDLQIYLGPKVSRSPIPETTLTQVWSSSAARGWPRLWRLRGGGLCGSRALWGPGWGTHGVPQVWCRKFSPRFWL
jgi:hypothetical protein